MIDNDKTVEMFGYMAEALTMGSNKKIILSCDYCGAQIINTPKVRAKSNKFCDKDACVTCKFKKRADVSLSRDGVSNSSQRQEVRNKISDTSKDRLQSEEYKREIKQTMMDKYGAASPMHVPALVKKQKSTLMSKYGVDNPTKNKQIAMLVGKKARQTKIDRGLIRVIDGLTLPELARKQGFSRSHFGKIVRKHGIEYALQVTHGETSLEKCFSSWFEELGICFNRQFRVDRKVADFKVGDVIIECDGLYWHSDIFLEDSYHQQKRQLYIDNGYKPLFFRGDEIRDKFEIIKSITLNALGICHTKYYARKLEVREIDFSTSSKFIKQNHLMGPTNTVSASFALYNDDVPVCVLQMKRSKDKDYEIARFCSSLGASVVGGFSRLLKAFKIKYGPDKISTFIDLRYGTGSYLYDMGFKLDTCYKSFVWTDGVDTYHRLKFRGNSGYEKGLYKIWDCGQARLSIIS